MKYSKRKDKYCCNVLNDNFQEIYELLTDLEKNGGGGGGGGGAPGKDGVSVSSIEQTTTSTVDGGTNVITCILSDGTKTTFEILNGSKGSSGKDGKDGVKGETGSPGKDGISCTHTWSGTVLNVTSASGTSSADLKGEKGDNGTRGTRWTVGTTMGTVVSDFIAPSTGLSDSLAGDYYLNHNNGYIYQCVLSGDADTAKWSYIGVLLNVDSLQEDVETLSNDVTIVKRNLESIQENEFEQNSIILALDSRVEELENNSGSGGGGTGVVTVDKASYETTFDYQCDTIAPLETVSIFRDIVYGNGRYVIVGSGGISYYSTDGVSWTAMTGLQNATYNSVTYGNGRFVCVGDLGNAAYSTNGTSWTAMTGLSGAIYYSVTYGNGRFVCVGLNGESYYSTDGKTWTTMFGLSSGTFSEVVYGKDRFVCVGVGGSYYSIDGAVWTAMTGASVNVPNLAYCNDRFVCVGSNITYYSTDGETWNKLMHSGNISSFSALAYGNGVFMGIKNEAIFYSFDGVVWLQLEILHETNLYNIKYYNDRFITVSDIPTLIIGSKSITTTIAQTEETVTDVVSELYNKSVIIKKVLRKGETKVTITNDKITRDSVLTFYTSIYGVSPIGVEVENGSVELTFNIQRMDMDVGVSVDG